MMGCSVYSFSQVEIHNTSPNATLDVADATDDKRVIASLE